MTSLTGSVHPPARYINLGLVTALLLLISTGIAFYFHIDRLQANARSIQHSYEVQSSLDVVLSTLKDAETGQRGYIITGDEQYLEPYQTAIAQIDAQLYELQTLSHDLQTPDDPQPAQLTELETTIASRLAMLRTSIEQRRSSGQTAAEEIVRSGQGKALMDGIRQQIAQMQIAEADRLAQRQQESQTSFRQAIDAVTIALALDLLLLGLVYALFRRDRHLRQQEDDRQQQLNASLEQRVQERTAQLQEANAELEAFSYSVAHDLRAPLRGMQGFAEALLEDYGDRLDAEGREYAQFIIASAQRLEVLIQDLLAYSRLSRAELPLRTIDLNAAIAFAIEQLDGDLIHTQAQIIVQPDLPAVVGHQTTLIQVVSNLLGNAVKFVAEGVRPKVEISAEERGDRVRLWVIDNGIGIEDKYYSRIFRVFERLHGIEAYPGTGIGLAIVRKGMERMGGSAGIESELNVGSRFWIEFRSIENQ